MTVHYDSMLQMSAISIRSAIYNAAQCLNIEMTDC